jgi:hypothetical protein
MRNPPAWLIHARSSGGHHVAGLAGAAVNATTTRPPPGALITRMPMARRRIRSLRDPADAREQAEQLADAPAALRSSSP